MSLYDTQTLYDFLFHTPEGGLRKILIDKKTMTDVHCNLLIKIVKSASPEQFADLMEKKEFPRIRMSPAEAKLKEKFWDDCIMTLVERGVLQPMSAVPTKMAA